MTSGFRVTVEGGDKLKIRVGYNLGTLMFFWGSRVGVAEKQPAVPPPAK